MDRVNQIVRVIAIKRSARPTLAFPVTDLVNDGFSKEYVEFFVKKSEADELAIMYNTDYIKALTIHFLKVGIKVDHTFLIVD